MKQFVLVLFVLAALAATGRIASAKQSPANLKGLAGSGLAGSGPGEVHMFFSEDRTE